MVRIADCDACQIGDHANHHRTVRAVPEGALGGVVCPCGGECVESADERRAKFLRRIGLTPAVLKAPRAARKTP